MSYHENFLICLFSYSFNLLNMLNFERDHSWLVILVISWIFLATSHGKGTVDAIGGVVKNVVHRRVIAQDLIVNNAHEFCSLAIQHINYEKIKVVYVDADEMVASRSMLKERLKLVPAIPQIQKMHHFEVRSPSEKLCWPTSKQEESFKKSVKFNFEPLMTPPFHCVIFTFSCIQEHLLRNISRADT